MKKLLMSTKALQLVTSICTVLPTVSPMLQGVEMPKLCAALGEASLRLPPQVTAVLDAKRGRPRPGRGGRLIIDRCNPCAPLKYACSGPFTTYRAISSFTAAACAPHSGLHESNSWISAMCCVTG